MSCEGMDERDISEHLAGARAQVAMEVLACLGAVGGAAGGQRILPLATGGKAQAADEFAQHFRGVVMAALHVGW
jgi:hypothetical protein